MSDSPFEFRPFLSNAGHYVVEKSTTRLLAAVGNNAFRAWVFPLNTPRGLNVIQEYAFDHPFHNGVFVGQTHIWLNGKETNYWAPHVDYRNLQNPIYHHIGAIKPREPLHKELTSRGAQFIHTLTWYDEDGGPVLDEVRTIDIIQGEDATLCDVTSHKIAAYGALTYEATKHGVIGVRVQPQLIPTLGGQILAGEQGEIRRGTADEVASLKPCEFVAYEADVANLGRFGVCLAIRENTASADRTGTWFIRDYGMAMYNPTMLEPVHTPAGEAWTTQLRVMAYDGALTHARVQGWLAE